ncbi:DUF2490 domain-containing protein [Candidatus Marinimicrobia bacterium]|nr:DUF2490 domain-containing protein [Candidatus Neomarinimicrobiota bacterium]
MMIENVYVFPNYQKKFFKIIRQFSLLGVFFIALLHSYAHADTESWSSIGFGKKLPNSFKLDFEQSLRLKDDVSSFKQTFTESSISYNIFKGMKVFIPVRYAVFKNKTKKRISFGISYKNGWKKITFRCRSKLQRTYQNNKIFDPLIRNKLTAEPKINKKFKIYFSAEIFHFIYHSQFNYEEYRFSLGARINLGKTRETKIFYTQKTEGLSKMKQDKTNVIGLSYSFDW